MHPPTRPRPRTLCAYPIDWVCLQQHHGAEGEFLHRGHIQEWREARVPLPVPAPVPVPLPVPVSVSVSVPLPVPVSVSVSVPVPVPVPVPVRPCTTVPVC
jgi:hypothetical protein